MSIDILSEVVGTLPENLQMEVLSYARKLQSEKDKRRSPKVDKFWSLIDLIELYHQDDEKKIHPLISALSELPEEDIYDFIDVFDQTLYDIDGPLYMEAFGNSEYGASSDSFLYGRCFVVAQGRIIYEQVKASPQKFPPGVWLESLLFAADEAYEIKTGKEINYYSGIVYETGWNEKHWNKSMAQITYGITEDELRKKATPRKQSGQPK